MNTITRRGRRSSLAAMLAIPLLVMGLAACAPSTEGSPKETNSGGGGTSNSASASSRDEWAIDYAQCMRDQGIDVPDPEPGSGGLSAAVSGDDVDQAAMQEASEKCMEELGDPPAMSPDEQKAVDEQMLKWAKDAAECYREHGYDMPDPDGKSLNFPADAPEDVMMECGGGQMSTGGGQ